MYYACAIDPNMLPDINEISTWKSAPTHDTLGKCNQVLDYESTHPNATIWYHASDMILMTDTNTAYIVILTDLIHIAGHYYFTNHMPD